LNLRERYAAMCNLQRWLPPLLLTPPLSEFHQRRGNLAPAYGALRGQIPVIRENNREFCQIGCIAGSLLGSKQIMFQWVSKNSL
jgi:hypothetical protein